MTASLENEDRILTVPNAITVVRLLLLPVFVWLLLSEERRLAAAFLLGGLGATDWVDGWFARRFNQVSTVGKVLDPVADRLLLGVSVVAILIDGSVPWVVAILIAIREIIVSVATVALAALGAARIDVTWIGKTGAFFNMIAFPAFLVANTDVALADAMNVAGWIAAVIGIGASWWSLREYVPAGRAALAAGRG